MVPNANINVFKQAINEISWPIVFSDNSNSELSFSEFTETFLNAYNISFPIKKRHVITFVWFFSSVY
jgi:hypothetical protein